MLGKIVSVLGLVGILTSSGIAPATSADGFMWQPQEVEAQAIETGLCKLVKDIEGIYHCHEAGDDCHA